MSNTLAQTAVRLDLPRGLALVEPVVERRGRRWDPRQQADGSEADPAERANAAGDAAALLAQQPARGEQGSQAASKMRSGMLSETASNGENEAEAKEPARAPQRAPEPATVRTPAETKDQNKGRDSKIPAPALGAAGLPATQQKPPAPSPQLPDRRPESAASAARQPQQVVAAPNVKLAGFPEATAEHTASRELTATRPHGDDQDVAEPRKVTVRFPRATLASDSPAQPGAAVSRTGSGPIAAGRIDAGSTGSPEHGAVDGLTTPVRILSKPLPRYPTQALEQHQQGDVLVDVEFRYSGTLEILGVRQGLSPRLNESALEAARKIRFLPARRDGRPVDTQATVCIRFQLDP